MPFPNWIRNFNKHYTNKLFLRFAGKSKDHFAVLYHRGRLTGKEYAVPVLTFSYQDGFLFALTYGSQVDWYQNILHNGSARLLWHSQEFVLQDPKSIDPETAMSQCPASIQFFLKILKVRDYFWMKVDKPST